MSTKYKVGDKVELHSNCREINQKDINETGNGVGWNQSIQQVYEERKQKGFTISGIQELYNRIPRYQRGKPLYYIDELNWWVCEHFIAGPHDKKNQPISW